MSELLQTIVAHMIVLSAIASLIAWLATARDRLDGRRWPMVSIQRGGQCR